MLVDLAALMDMPLKPDKIGCNDVGAYFSPLFGLPNPPVLFFPPSVNFQRSSSRDSLARFAAPGENWPSASALVKPRLSPGKWELAWSRFDHARNRGADRTRRESIYQWSASWCSNSEISIRCRRRLHSPLLYAAAFLSAGSRGNDVPSITVPAINVLTTSAIFQ